MATVSTPFDSQADDQSQNPSSQGSVAPVTPTGSNSGVNQTSTSNGAPVQTSGTSGSTGGGSTSSGSQTGGGVSAPTNSGSYTNLQKYLNANQGFDSSQGGLGGEIASNINNSAQGINQNIQGASNAFNQQAQQAQQSYAVPTSYQPVSTAPVSGAMLDTNQTPAGPAASAPSPSQASSSTPSYQSYLNSIIGNAGNAQQSDIQSVNNMANANYAGPTSLNSLTGNQNLGALQLQTGNLANQANDTQSEQGRMSLLNQMFGNNNYTQGQQTLDNLLIQNSPQQMAQLNGVNQTANTTQQALNNANTAATGSAAQDTANAQAIQQYTQGALNSAITGENSALGQQASTANANATAAQNSLLQALQTGQFSNSQAQQLGLQNYATVNPAGSPALNATQQTAQQQALAGIANGTAPDQLYFGSSLPTTFSGLSQYGIVADPTQATAQNVATANQYAQMQNLGQMLGTKANTDISGILSSYANPSQAGAYAASGSPYTVNQSAFDAANQQAQSQFNANQQAAGNQAYINSLQNAPSTDLSLGTNMTYNTALQDAKSGNITGAQQLMGTLGSINGQNYGEFANTAQQNAMSGITGPTNVSIGQALNNIIANNGGPQVVPNV